MNFIIRIILHVFLAIVLLGMVLLAIAYFFQNKLFYYPNSPSDSKEIVRAPDSAGFSSHESITLIAADDINISAFWIPFVKPETNQHKKHKHGSRKHGDAENLPTILYFQGDAGNIGHRLPKIARLIKHVPCNVMMLSYRGY